MKLKLTILAATLSLATTAFAGETQQTFNAADMQQLFGQKSESTQLATLSQQEMKETEGAHSYYGMALPIFRDVKCIGGSCRQQQIILWIDAKDKYGHTVGHLPTITWINVPR